ncbi:MAG: hypothetical protein CMN93_06565 [Synechococcus sp. CPC35]|nr:hypothetical protein [Synechococcus sp. CPC35]
MSEVQQDAVLNSFIELARKDQALKAEIKAALNQEQVIAIAASRGYEFDSLTILRKWSQHTDFSKDTWMGWFEE